MTFKSDYRDWVEFRKFPDLLEFDMHWSEEISDRSYHENVEQVPYFVQRCLENAQKQGKKYVMFTHGHSTSRIGKTTTRSQVRKFMRSKVATPLIVREESIQHYSVFVAAVRPLLAEQSEEQGSKLMNPS